MIAAFHTGEVTGLAACICKPLVATASRDQTVRLWNVAERTAELTRTFGDIVLSVALHPSAHCLLVGCADKLRLLAVLLDDLRYVTSERVELTCSGLVAWQTMHTV